MVRRGMVKRLYGRMTTSLRADAELDEGRFHKNAPHAADD